MTLYEILKKYVEETFDEPSSIIYHYTNYGKEIINSGHLRLSAHDVLNKKNNRELIIGPRIVREKLQTSSFAPMLPRLINLLNTVLKCM